MHHDFFDHFQFDEICNIANAPLKVKVTSLMAPAATMTTMTTTTTKFALSPVNLLEVAV